ncbi:hypothetical protein TgHK011_007714 [Trichoderma gracile]|nr:hypothetical protein TgHK011_007714 [Trichoderma gracile]
MFPLFSPPPLDSPLRSSLHALSLPHLVVSLLSLLSLSPGPDDRPNASRKASAPFPWCQHPLIQGPVAIRSLLFCSRPAGYGLLRVRVPATACVGWSGRAWHGLADGWQFINQQQPAITTPVQFDASRPHFQLRRVVTAALGPHR